MLIEQLEDIAIITAINLFFIIPLSIYSLKFHAVRHKANEEDVNLFLDTLIRPLRLLYSMNLKGIYYADKQHTPEQIENSLFLQRIIVSIIPVMFIAVDLFGLIRSLISQDGLLFRYLVAAVLLPILLLAAWRFGRKLTVFAV